MERGGGNKTPKMYIKKKKMRPLWSERETKKKKEGSSADYADHDGGLGKRQIGITSRFLSLFSPSFGALSDFFFPARWCSSYVFQTERGYELIALLFLLLL